MPNIKTCCMILNGLGLTLLCLYLLVLGLRVREVRWQCALLLAGSLFGVCILCAECNFVCKRKDFDAFCTGGHLLLYAGVQKSGRVRRSWRLWPL